jgi:putative ABC transport system permease protein
MMTIKNLFSRKLRSWLTMIGIFIGIAAVVSLISLGQGMQAAIMEEFEALGTDKIFVFPKGGFAYGMGGEVKLDDSDMDVVRRVRGIDSVAAMFYNSGGKIEFNDEVRYNFFIGMPMGEEQKLTDEIFRYYVDVGRNLKKGDKYKVVLGYNYANKNVFDKNIKLRDKILLNDVEFKVIGFYELIGNPEDDKNIYMTLEVLQDLISAPDEVNYVLAKVKTGVDIEFAAESIKKELRDHRDVEEGKEDFTVQTPLELLESFNTILLIVQVVLIGIACISLLVGGIGIMNTMYTSVLERTNEIGIMKAIGAENHDIFIIFLIESGILGVAGGIIGLVLGVLASLGVSAMITSMGVTLIKAVFPWYLTIGSIIFSFVVGSISGVFPALQASRLQPVEAMRQE